MVKKLKPGDCIRKREGHIKKRQEQGIAAAKARGVRFGRPEKPVPEDFEKIVLQWQNKALNFSQVLELCNMSAATFYKRLR